MKNSSKVSGCSHPGELTDHVLQKKHVTESSHQTKSHLKVVFKKQTTKKHRKTPPKNTGFRLVCWHYSFGSYKSTPKMKQNFLPRKTSGRNLKITPKWNGRIESKTQISIKFGWKKSRHFRVGNGGSLDVKCIRDESSIFSRGHSQPCWKMDANNPSSANPKRCNLGPSTRQALTNPLKAEVSCHVIMLGKKSSYPPVNQQIASNFI